MRAPPRRARGHHAPAQAKSTMNTTGANNNTEELIRIMEERRKQAIKYMQSKGYDVVQKNGQQVSIKLDCEPPKNPDQCEVFIGKIPRDLYEDELMPHLERVGTVYKLRLMMDFSGFNRGFGFALFTSPRGAANACFLLDKTKLRADENPIGVLRSFNNRRLHFCQLPLKCTRSVLFNELNRLVEDVEDVEMLEVDKDATYGHAYVTFKTHDAATQARRVLLPAKVQIFNCPISIDWAKPNRPPMDLCQSPVELANRQNVENAHRMLSQPSNVIKMVPPNPFANLFQPLLFNQNFTY